MISGLFSLLACPTQSGLNTPHVCWWLFNLSLPPVFNANSDKVVGGTDTVNDVFINPLTLVILNYCLSSCQRQQKQRQLLGRLQDLLLGPKADEQTTCEVLDYFLRRLSSSQVASRVLAMKVRHW